MTCQSQPRVLPIMIETNGPLIFVLIERAQYRIGSKINETHFESKLRLH